MSNFYMEYDEESQYNDLFSALYDEAQQNDDQELLDRLDEFEYDANDYEKHLVLEYYNNHDKWFPWGLHDVRVLYNTEMIYNDYDAYLAGVDAELGDFDITDIERDDNDNLVSVTYAIHSDRWACMSDDWNKRDNITEETLYFDE